MKSNIDCYNFVDFFLTNVTQHFILKLLKFDNSAYRPFLT